MAHTNGGPSDPPPDTPALERVADRVRAFHTDPRFDGPSITFTDLPAGYRFETDPDEMGGQAWVVATAVVSALATNGKPWTVAQGTARHAYPRGGQEIERVQTAAIGRALAAAGYPGSTSVEATEGIAAHAGDPARTLADQDQVKRLLANAFPNTEKDHQRQRLAAIKRAGLPYESVAAALMGMTVGELDRLSKALEEPVAQDAS